MDWVVATGALFCAIIIGSAALKELLIEARGVRGLSLVGMILAGLLAAVISHDHSWVVIALTTSLCALCAFGAIIDRHEAMISDIWLGTTVVIACAWGAAVGSWDLAWPLAAAAGFATFLVVEGVWVVLRRFSDQMDALPPGDLLTLLMPLGLFGISEAALAAYMLIMIVTFLAVKNHHIRSIATSWRFREISSDELGEEGSRAIPLLTVTLPVYVTLLLCHLLEVL